MPCWLLLLVTSLPAVTPQIESTAPDVAVVCPPALREGLEPWLDYRSGQGRRIELVDGSQTSAAIKTALRSAYDRNPRLSIVLVGDADPAADAEVRARSVPTHLSAAKVNVIFGSEPEIAGDNWYADFDDDGAPEAPIGRMPVDSADELQLLTGRIVDYERSADVGPWRRRINLVAGLGGFGPIADAALEAATKTLLTSHLPPAYDTTMTYASWQSPYFPGPTAFRTTTLDRFNEGCLMWVYIGHGHRREVDRLYSPAGAHSILDVRDMPQLRARHRPPLALFLSCYSGAFDGPQDCLAEEMLRSEGGPVGVLCGSRVTMPYAMSILAQELMTSVFNARAATIGEALRDTKRALALKPRESASDKQFDAVAKMLMPMAADLDAQRREHLALFNLLGDPLLRLRHPEPVELVVPEEATAENTIRVSGRSPVAGRATLEFVVRRDRFTFRPTERNEYDLTPSGQAEMTATYARANDSRLAGSTFELPAGPFAFDVAVPATAKGDCHVRVYVEGADEFALGSADVKVRSAERTTTAARP